MRDTCVAMLLFVDACKCYHAENCVRFRGKLRDTILDWEDALPSSQLDMAERHCRQVEHVVHVQLTYWHHCVASNELHTSLALLFSV